MAKVLTEISRQTTVNATAKSGEYEYSVAYSFTDKVMNSLQCNVNKVTQSEDSGEVREYAGYMSLEGENKSMNFPASENGSSHATMFEKIVSEVKTGIAG
ncbi:hypothetical protein ABLT32_13510 [Bacteroides pyogenes]|uniref:hypothetical protein n=1 Tax=Bacteroides pyogenes TaxID=310300 RepID=UPI0040633DFF